MKKVQLLLFIACILIAGKIYPQSGEKISIAILPFTKTGGSNTMSVSLVQETVTKEFVERKRFEIVDHSKFDDVIKELNIQKSEEFLNSNVVEQGKLAGAQFLVTGVVGDMRISSGTKQTYDLLQKKMVSKTEYQGYVNLSFQVIDVAKGTAVYSENIDAYSISFSSNNEGAILSNALCHLKNGIRKALTKEFPEDIQIIQVEKKDKKGLPEMVLISAGESIFSEESGKRSACDEGGLSIIFGSKKTKVFLSVFEVQMMTVNGKDIKRQTEVGSLLLSDVQGDLSVCEVKDGAKAILEKLNAGQKLLVRVQ